MMSGIKKKELIFHFLQDSDLGEILQFWQVLKQIPVTGWTEIL